MIPSIFFSVEGHLFEKTCFMFIPDDSGSSTDSRKPEATEETGIL